MMKLLRLCSGEYGTMGVLYWYLMPFAVTMERPWRNNESGISCIPAGKYTAVRCRASQSYGYKDSPHFGDTFTVENVPGRSKILIHKGNIDDDSHGCILIGESFGFLNGEPAVLSSKAGFGEFMTLTSDIDSFELEILWAQTS